MGTLLLGIDIGTTATKGILLHPERGIVSESQATSTLHSPQPGWAEEDPAEWWANVGRVARACLTQAGATAENIAAAGVSGMVPTLILLDADGRVLRPSIMHNDARAAREIREFQTQMDPDDVLARTGSPISQQSIGPKLLCCERDFAVIGGADDPVEDPCMPCLKHCV